MKWIIEVDRSDDISNIKLAKALERAGQEYTPFVYKPFMSWTHVLKEIGLFEEPTMSFGSINFITKVQKITFLKPGSICNFAGLECRAYYPFMKDVLLNSDYKIVKWGDLISKGFGGQRFIRPNSGRKVFTGLVSSYEDIQYDIARYTEKMNKETLVLITSPKDIKKEWRFFVTKGRVLSYSLYHMNNSHIPINWPDDKAFELAEQASLLYEPDPIWVIDICLTAEGEYKVLELNGLSCSGLYACDVDPIVEEIMNKYEPNPANK